MKKLFKKPLQFALRILAKKILKKFKPKIIAITGSVGKTSAKEAIYAVIDDGSVLKNEGNYNNEIGIPATILGVKATSSMFGWSRNIFKSLSKTIYLKKYYKKLVLEMGADHPNDIKYLASFIKPDIAVVTAIGPAHLEYFKTLENIAREKMRLVGALGKEGYAILNFDDQLIREHAAKVKAKVISYGTTDMAELRATDIIMLRTGVGFKLHWQGNVIPIHLNLLGRSQVLAALAAIGVGIALGMDLVAISERLLRYSPPEGRGNLVEIGELMIINDTYNANPMSMIAAIETLDQIGKAESKRRVAILGDMYELGPEEISGHENVGKAVVNKVDFLIAVGERARNIEAGARVAGLPGEKAIWVKSPDDLNKKIKTFLEASDLVLIKGSRAMKMEKIISYLKQEL